MKKIPYKNSAQILAHFELSEEASALVNGETLPTEAIAKLQEAGLNIDLTNYLAHALPMREAIWWSVQATLLRKADLTNQELKLINESGKWVKDPNEAARRHIEKTLEPLPNESSARWVGQSVFWSGQGSIAPADLPVVMPADLLYAKAVAGAVNTAAALPEWSGYKAYYKKVFSSAVDIANGGSGMISEGGQ